MSSKQFQELSPLSKAPKRTIRKRKCGKTGVLNSTPELKQMKDEELEKERKNLAGTAKINLNKQ